MTLAAQPNLGCNLFGLFLAQLAAPEMSETALSAPEIHADRTALDLHSASDMRTQHLPRTWG